MSHIYWRVVKNAAMSLQYRHEHKHPMLPPIYTTTLSMHTHRAYLQVLLLLCLLALALGAVVPHHHGGFVHVLQGGLPVSVGAEAFEALAPAPALAPSVLSVASPASTESSRSVSGCCGTSCNECLLGVFCERGCETDWRNIRRLCVGSRSDDELLSLSLCLSLSPSHTSEITGLCVLVRATQSLVGLWTEYMHPVIATRILAVKHFGRGG